MEKTYLLIWAITVLVVMMIHGVSSNSNDDAKQVFNRKVKAFNNHNNNKIAVMVAIVNADGSFGGALQDALAGLQNLTSVAKGLLNDTEMAPCAEDIAALGTLVIDAGTHALSGKGLYILFEDIISILRTKNGVKNDCKKVLEDPTDPNAIALRTEYDQIKKVIEALLHQFPFFPAFQDLLN